MDFFNVQGGVLEKNDKEKKVQLPFQMIIKEREMTMGQWIELKCKVLDAIGNYFGVLINSDRTDLSMEYTGNEYYLNGSVTSEEDDIERVAMLISDESFSQLITGQLSFRRDKIEKNENSDNSNNNQNEERDEGGNMKTVSIGSENNSDNRDNSNNDNSMNDSDVTIEIMPRVKTVTNLSDSKESDSSNAKIDESKDDSNDNNVREDSGAVVNMTNCRENENENENSKDDEKEIESLFGEWNEWLNNGEAKFDSILFGVRNCTELKRLHDAFANQLCAHGGLLVQTYEKAFENEDDYLKYLQCLSLLLSIDVDKIFNECESSYVPEKLLDGMVKYSGNRSIVNESGNIIRWMIDKSRSVWKRFVESNMDKINVMLDDCIDSNWECKEYIVHLIDIIHKLFYYSGKYKHSHLKDIFRIYSKNYFGKLIKIVRCHKWDSVAFSFCQLLYYVLNVPKIKLKEFLNLIIFDGRFDIFSLLIEDIGLRISRKYYFDIANMVLNVLIALLKHKANGREIRYHLVNCNCFEIVLKEINGHLMMWPAKKDNGEYLNGVSCMIQFLTCFHKIDLKSIARHGIIEYLCSLAGLSQWGMKRACRLSIFTLNFEEHACNQKKIYSLNYQRSRTNVMFPVVSPLKLAQDGNKLNSNRNILFDVFGAYFTDSTYIFSFSDKIEGYVNLGNEMNSNVDINCRLIGKLDIDEALYNLFLRLFDSSQNGNNGVESVSLITSTFLEKRNEFRNALAAQPILNGVIGTKNLTFAQTRRLRENLDIILFCQFNNEIVLAIVECLDNRSLFICSSLNKRWNRVIKFHKQIEDRVADCMKRNEMWKCSTNDKKSSNLAMLSDALGLCYSEANDFFTKYFVEIIFEGMTNLTVLKCINSSCIMDNVIITDNLFEKYEMNKINEYMDYKEDEIRNKYGIDASELLCGRRFIVSNLLDLVTYVELMVDKKGLFEFQKLLKMDLKVIAEKRKEVKRLSDKVDINLIIGMEYSFDCIVILVKAFVHLINVSIDN